MPLDSFVASLLGLCLGDALGAPVEAAPPGDAAAYVAALRAGTVGRRGRHPYSFGQYTDDGQLARELVASIAESGGWNPGAFAARLMRGAANGGFIGAGQATARTAARLAAGVACDEAGEPAPYDGNGAAIRVAMLGPLWAGDQDRLDRVALAQAAITHRDPRSQAAALVVARAAAAMTDGAAVEPVALLGLLARVAEPVSPELARAIALVPDWLRLEPEQAWLALADAGLEPRSNRAAWQGISASAVPSVVWSLYSALRAPDEWWETVCVAISPGGDTDSMAAMAGGIVGARVGTAGLPRHLLASLTDRGQWGEQALTQLAGRAWQAR